MTAPTTRATPKIALDQRAASRHDNAVSNEVTIVAAALPEQHGAQKKERSKALPSHRRR